MCGVLAGESATPMCASKRLLQVTAELVMTTMMLMMVGSLAERYDFFPHTTTTFRREMLHVDLAFHSVSLSDLRWRSKATCFFILGMLVTECTAQHQ